MNSDEEKIDFPENVGKRRFVAGLVSAPSVASLLSALIITGSAVIFLQLPHGKLITFVSVLLILRITLSQVWRAELFNQYRQWDINKHDRQRFEGQIVELFIDAYSKRLESLSKRMKDMFDQLGKTKQQALWLYLNDHRVDVSTLFDGKTPSPEDELHHLQHHLVRSLDGLKRLWSQDRNMILGYDYEDGIQVDNNALKRNVYLAANKVINSRYLRLHEIMNLEYTFLYVFERSLSPLDSHYAAKLCEILDPKIHLEAIAFDEVHVFSQSSRY